MGMTLIINQYIEKNTKMLDSDEMSIFPTWIKRRP